MLVRVKLYLVFVSLSIMAGLSFLYRQTVLSMFLPQLVLANEDLPVNVTDGYYNGGCQKCSSCDIQPHSKLEVVQDWDSLRVLRGTPTKYFRDNLLNDTQYLTTWAAGGFTNQFITYVNLIYLAALSDRVPIIPPFGPGAHISSKAGALPFGQIFNLTRLRNDLRRPILEWSDVKYIPSPASIENPPDSEREQLGCWSTFPENSPQPLWVVPLLNNLRLDISFTRVPTSTRHSPDNDQDNFVMSSKLVPYISSRNPMRGHFDLLSPSPLGHRLPPDEHLSCFDHLYYIISNTRYEWEEPWSPAWNLVGRNVQFNDKVVEIAKGYLSRAFNLTEGEIPPFISVHARRGDFSAYCRDHKITCLNPISAFAEKIDEIRKTLLQKHGKNVTQVLLTSDEEDPDFWAEARGYGWVYFNHTEERTEEKLGEWFAPIVDIVSQSFAVGFVGTEHSTFSLVSARRVEDWNNGPTILLPPSVR